MTEASIPERHFARIARVPRATRQDWAARGLTSTQSAPYDWVALAEVVCLRELRGRFELIDIEVLWPQMRAQVQGWKASEPAEVLADLVTLGAMWCPETEQLLRQLRGGGPVQLIDLVDALAQAYDGFTVAAPASGPRREKSDELAGKRQRRKTKRASG